MQDSHSIENDFINRITEIIQENIANEKFGVSELASEIGMSRSNLLRKIKKETKLSASQFIRQVRLKNAMEMLRSTSLNVSEVSYQVGFGTTSYFIKCFHDYYGYPPGEVGNRDFDESGYLQVDRSRKNNIILIVGAAIIFVLLAVALIIFIKPFPSGRPALEKSIAVLPFKNDSNDSSNIYFINGLMESILNDLQKIEDLRVISRTSVEKFRNNPKTIPEIARELNVNYFVEGSGQKIGDQILLNIQLIEAQTDKHLWSKQYTREAKDIFHLQKEVSRNIAAHIRAIITPEEEERIDKIPTDDLAAYDYFLQGRELMYKGGRENLETAITFYEKAIELDNEFARAYAGIAITYFFLDFLQTERKYSEQINFYADKALLLDSQSVQALIAKALYYMYAAEYQKALPYLEKAHEYNPNSALAINILSDFYANYIPDTEKYLEYALKGIRLDIASNDSVTASIIYLHISNAFIQSGFVSEAEKYINKSLQLWPGNIYSERVKPFIHYAQSKNLQQTKKLLIKAFNKDTNNLDIMQEVGKICYYMRDYESAYHYYKRFLEIKEAQNLNVYRSENAKIGVVLEKMGLLGESEKYFDDYLEYAENDQSVYKHLSLAVYYSYQGEQEKAIEHLELFSQQTNYFYWIILFLEIDPLIDKIKDLPEFHRIFDVIELKFWNYHKQIRDSLKKKNLL